MQKSLRVLGAIALIGLGIWSWRIFFPDPERAIRSRLSRLARAISFEPQDGALARSYGAEKAAGLFTLDAEVIMDMRGAGVLEFDGRDEILQHALAGTRALQGLRVELLDVNISLGADKQTAKANLTGKWALAGEKDYNRLDLVFYFKKVDDAWQIYRVESVKIMP